MSNTTDDTLSRCATELAGEVTRIDAVACDVMLHGGGGECVSIVAKAAAERAERIARTYGFPTLSAAVAAIERRTTSKFVYEMGFGSLAGTH